jgi:NADH-quinone oxidoreductase subunit I
MLGEGIIKGMAQTAKNFFGSYTSEERLTTVEYPEEQIPVKENNRNFPFLVYDNEPEKGLRCVACKICEKECPPQCIYIVLRRDEKGKPQKHPEVFDIDVTVCMSCQICVEVCPFDAIKMDQVFELSQTGRFEELLLHKQDLAKSNTYFHKIHPTEADEVDTRLAEEKAKAEAAKAAKPAVPAAGAAAPKPAAPAAAGTTPAAAKPEPAPAPKPTPPPTATPPSPPPVNPDSPSVVTKKSPAPQEAVPPAPEKPAP